MAGAHVGWPQGHDSRLLRRRPDGQHRAWGQADHALSDAPQHEMAKAGAPMRAPDDQVHLFGGRGLRHPLLGEADHDAACDLHRCIWDQGVEMPQHRRGLRLDGLEQERALLGGGMAVDEGRRGSTTCRTVSFAPTLRTSSQAAVTA